MSNTVFQDFKTPIMASWLNDVNGITYGLGQSSGSSLVGFGQHTVENKLSEFPSLLDYSGGTDDARFLAAKASGVVCLRVPSGVHATATGWAIAEADTLASLIFEPGAQLLLTAATNAIALDIQKQVFEVWGTCNVKSTGTKADGLNTVGVRVGLPVVGKSHVSIESLRFENFSGHGGLVYQPVFCGIDRIFGLNSTYGLSILPNITPVGGTTVEIGRSYISGCKRGIYANSCSWLTIREPVLEYCGDATTTDGALHFVSCGSVTVIDRYGEANYRNMVKDDSNVVFINGSMMAATSPDVISYSGVAFAQRGSALIQSYKLGIRRIDYDAVDNEDLVIGSNLTVPKSGGSVIHGNETKSVASGTLVSATWVTVAAIPSAESGPAVNAQALYEYVCYAGTADLSTGFDAGTLMNGVLRSYSGALPAWLRFSGGNIQMLVTSASYGLNYKIVLRRVFPG